MLLKERSAAVMSHRGPLKRILRQLKQVYHNPKSLTVFSQLGNEPSVGESKQCKELQLSIKTLLLYVDSIQLLLQMQKHCTVYRSFYKDPLFFNIERESYSGNC